MKMIKSIKTKHLLVAFLCVITLLFGAFGMSASAASSEVTGQGGEHVTDSNIWTLYAELLMGNSNVKDSSKKASDVSSESGFWHPIDKTLGSNGVSVDMPFTYMSNYGNSYSSVQYGGDAGSNGRLLASTLATYSNYNYFETVSGNAVASTTSTLLSGFGRVVGGSIGVLSLLLDKVANGLRDILTNVAVAVNPLNLVGFGNATDSALSASGKPIFNAINSFFDAMGINKDLFKAITGITFVIITGIFAARLMYAIASEKFRPGSKYQRAFKPYLQKFMVLFILMPIEGYFLSIAAQGIQSYRAKTTGNTNTVLEHLVNDRNWAYALNLSPNGENGTVSLPSAWAKQSYIDPSFNPAQTSVQKNIITSINVNGYKASGLTDKTDMALDLLGVWTSNSTFNVNTYAGDVIGVEKKSIPPILAGGGNEAARSVDKDAKEDAGNGKKYPKINSDATRRDLAAYIWSADQSPSDDSMKPDGKGRGAGYAFVAGANFGVQANSTFSTQSVALMLQSSFDNQGVHFYAYNITPSGAQGKAKNLSTVKTEWRAASLVGDGMFGQIATFFEMIAESLSHSVLVLAAVWALLTVQLISSMKTTLLRFWQVMTTLAIGPEAGLFAYGLGILAVALLVMNIPDVVITLIGTITSVIPSLFGADNYGAPIQLISSVALLVVTYCMAFVTIPRYDATPMHFILSFPLELAEQFDKKAMELDKHNRENNMFGRAEAELAGGIDTDNSGTGSSDGQSVFSEAEALAAYKDSGDGDTPLYNDSQDERMTGQIPGKSSAERKHDPTTANSAKIRREIAKRKGIVPDANKQATDQENTADKANGNAQTGDSQNQKQLLDANGRPLTSLAQQQRERNALAKGGLDSLDDQELKQLESDQFAPEQVDQDVADSQHLSDAAFNQDAAKDQLADIDDGKFMTEDENGELMPDLKAINTAMKIGDSPYATEEQRETAEKLKSARDAGAQSLREKSLLKNGYDRNGKPVLSAEESENILANAHSKKDFNAMFDDDRHMQDVATAMPSSKAAIAKIDNGKDYFKKDTEGNQQLDLNRVHQDIMAGTEPSATGEQKKLSSSLMSAQNLGRNELRKNTQASIKKQIKVNKPGTFKRMSDGAKDAVNSAESGSVVALLRDSSKAVNKTVTTHRDNNETARKDAMRELLSKSKKK